MTSTIMGKRFIGLVKSRIPVFILLWILSAGAYFAILFILRFVWSSVTVFPMGDFP